MGLVNVTVGPAEEAPAHVSTSSPLRETHTGEASQGATADALLPASSLPASSLRLLRPPVEWSCGGDSQCTSSTETHVAGTGGAACPELACPKLGPKRQSRPRGPETLRKSEPSTRTRVPPARSL